MSSNNKSIIECFWSPGTKEIPTFCLYGKIVDTFIVYN